jgi:pimeloyl-ACP methyl ester carboxylesterase
MTATDIRTSTLTSPDGTPVAVRQLGEGPGVVLVHGAMCSAHSHLDLARALATDHTVHLYDRREHGLAEDASYRPGPITTQEVDDLAAVLTATGARHAFGLSSGALVVLATALRHPESLDRIALYEPVLLDDAQAAARLRDELETDLDADDVTGALVTGWRGVQAGPGWLRGLPKPLLKGLVSLGLRADERHGKAGPYTPMRRLARGLRGDFGLVAEAAASDATGAAAEGADRFGSLRSDVLLLGGATSPAFLATALDRLEHDLPHARRVCFPGVGHEASVNADRRGAPSVVVPTLRRFFGDEPGPE